MMYNIEDYKSTYHPSWLNKTKFLIVNENRDWLLIKRTHPQKNLLHTQRILFNKNNGNYYTWQHINENLHYCKFKKFNGILDKKGNSKWIGRREFKYYETNINVLLDKLLVSCI